MTKVEAVKAAIVTAVGNLAAVASSSVYTRPMLALGEDTPDFPVVKVFAVDIAFTDIEDIATIGLLVRYNLELWVSVADGADPQTALNTLLQLVVDMVQANPTWGGQVQTTDLETATYEIGTPDSVVTLSILCNMWEATV